MRLLNPLCYLGAALALLSPSAQPLRAAEMPMPPAQIVLAKAQWSTETRVLGSLTFGFTYLQVEGFTSATRVTVETHGDGLISERPLKLDAGNHFSEKVEIAFTHMATPRVFTASTVLRAYQGATLIGSITLQSPPLSYVMPPTGKLKVSTFNLQQNPSNQIMAWIALENADTQAIPLETISLDYVFSPELSAGQNVNVWFDWCSKGGEFVQGAILVPNYTPYGYLLHTTFAPNALKLEKGEVLYLQVRMAKSDWSDFEQSNDWSFHAGATSYEAFDHVPVYVNGVLSAGKPPILPVQ